MGEYKKINVYELKDHPDNTFYFDDMTGGKWEELLESIRTSGVFSNIIITKDKTIVAGHQRVRACKELGIDEIGYEMIDFKDNNEITKCLIETNTKQKGTVADSDLKQGRRYKELERIYEIKHGGDRLSSCGRHNLITQKELAEKNGVSQWTWNNKKNLTNLIPELQELMLDKKLTTKVALIYSSMPPEEQLELYGEIGKEKISQMTQAETKEYVEKLKGLEQENQLLKSELNKEKNKQPSVVEVEKLVEIDKTDYDALAEMDKLKKDLAHKTEIYNLIMEKEKAHEQLMNAYQSDSEEYRKLRREMELLLEKKNNLSRSLNSATELSGLICEIESFMKEKLSPIKYSRALIDVSGNNIVQRNLKDIVQVVQNWCDEMSTYLINDNKNYIDVEVK